MKPHTTKSAKILRKLKPTSWQYQKLSLQTPAVARTIKEGTTGESKE